MSLSGATQIHGLSQMKTESSASAPVGQLAQGYGGELYRYTEAAGTALAVGKLTVAATQAANHENIAVQAAAAVDATEVSVTLGATAVTAGDYQDGFLVINDAAGEGHRYRISGHPAADSAATLTVQVADPVVVALTTSSEATLVKNPWKDTVISAADQADLPVGVPVVAIAADEYGWSQTRGICPVLADEAVTQGLAVTIGSSVVGAVEGADAAGEPIVGVAQVALVDTEYRAIYCKVD